MSDLNSLLAGKATLLKIIERYDAKIQMAQRELEEIDAALSVLNKYGIPVHDPFFPRPPQTVGEMALELLREHPEGLTANQILAMIHERWMPTLMRSSLSPPLSRLKHSGMVILEDNLWKASKSKSLFERFTSGLISANNQNNDQTDFLMTPTFRRHRTRA